MPPDMEDNLHPLLKEPVDMRDGVAGMERPRALLEETREEPTPLLSLAHRHIVSARQFSRLQIIQLCRLAADYESTKRLYSKPLSGKIMITAFYEPSTRTRLSFESAWHRLGGDIMSITDIQTTGIAKGESLQDVAEMFSNYGDVVTLRDNDESAIYSMLEKLRIPIINAGNGTDEHPTQALADMFAILKWKPEIASDDLSQKNKLQVGIIGTPGRMRTLRSLLLLLARFPEKFKVFIINPGDNIFSRDQQEELEGQGLEIEVVRGLKKVLPGLDIIYINSIAWVGDSYEHLTGDLKISRDLPLKESAIILHPLARGSELDPDLDQTGHNWYFAQARGAVFMRMALLTCITQRVSRVIDAPLPYN